MHDNILTKKKTWLRSSIKSSTPRTVLARTHLSIAKAALRLTIGPSQNLSGASREDYRASYRVTTCSIFVYSTTCTLCLKSKENKCYEQWNKALTLTTLYLIPLGKIVKTLSLSINTWFDYQMWTTKKKNNQMIPGYKNRFILWNLQKPVFPTFKNGAFFCNIAVANSKIYAFTR